MLDGRREMIVFRADASIRIGAGHVARCLSLARALRERGLQSAFVCRAGHGEPSAFIASQGFDLRRIASIAAPAETEAVLPASEQAADAAETVAAMKDLAGDVSWIVADHYGLSAHWEKIVAEHAASVMVIDDLANRPHACDLLLDQNHYADAERRYEGLVPPGCRLFLGPRHVLLRPEFTEAKARLRERDGTVRRILVAFGGSDESGQTIKTLNALRGLDLADIAIDVVAGASNPRRDALRALCASIPRCTYHEQVDYMARLIADADLSIGAGGAMTWERCALGLPTLSVVTAPNQLRTTVDTAAVGATLFLGESHALDTERIAAAVAAVIANPARNREISVSALDLVPMVDGASRMAQALSSFGRAAAPRHARTNPAGHS